MLAPGRLYGALVQVVTSLCSRPKYLTLQQLWWRFSMLIYLFLDVYWLCHYLYCCCGVRTPPVLKSAQFLQQKCCSRFWPINTGRNPFPLLKTFVPGDPSPLSSHILLNKLTFRSGGVKNSRRHHFECMNHAHAQKKARLIEQSQTNSHSQILQVHSHEE